MVHQDAALLYELFELAVAQGIGHVPADTGQDDVLLNMGSLEVHHALPPLLLLDDQREIIPEKAHEQKFATHPKDALRERIVHSSRRGTATELLAGRVAANTRPRDVTERAMKDRDRLRKRAYKGKYAAVVESQRNRIAVGEGRRRGEWFEGLVQQRPGPDIGR
jgi:hypothetical protein